jgi:hypothetical protein
MKRLLVMVMLLAAGWLAWRFFSSGPAEPADHGESLIYDRLWVDHLPQSETDTVQVFAAVTEQPIGIFQAASLWKGAWELFRYEPRGDGRLVIVYPQSGQKEPVGYHARRCATKRFDFCMELSGASRGVKRYYSQKGWEIGAAASPEALRGRVAALLGHPASR